ncbi:MAG TPA: MAPEG family protein [Alphaproteobacteria bacterium]|nr:MAPEG family protein [Alphaproteobacteria bacterium]
MPWAQGLVALVALGAMLLYFFMGARVGAARGKYKVEAPATTGDPIFERTFRVHQNTLEQMVPFLVGLYFFDTTLSALGAAALGVVWILGRIIYMQAYIANPKSRAPGMLLTVGATAILVMGGIIGVVLRVIRDLPH